MFFHYLSLSQRLIYVPLSTFKIVISTGMRRILIQLEPGKSSVNTTPFLSHFQAYLLVLAPVHNNADLQEYPVMPARIAS